MPDTPPDANGALQSVHLERTGDFGLPCPVERAIAFFSPEGERTWVPGWDPEYLHPDRPSTSPGTVFRTTHQGEMTLWLVLRYDRLEGRAEYVRITPDSRMGIVRVHCRSDGPGSTRVSVTYELTALSPDGAKVLSSLNEERYARMLEEWRTRLREACR